MNCDLAQRSLSAMADGELADADPADVLAHTDGCADCQAFGATITAIRQRLRFEPVGPLPDLAPAIVRRAERERRQRRWPPMAAVAAALVIGMVAGATFIGVGRSPRHIAAADLPDRIFEVQPAVTTIQATLRVRDADGTAWDGSLAYRAPESLAVLLSSPDGTTLATVADGDRWWATWPRRCAPPAPSACAPALTRAVDGRAPFSEDAPVPLELVAPVGSLAESGPPLELGRRSIGGHTAIGIAVPAAQVASLLRGIDPNSALAAVHPTDVAELWLEEARLVPLELTVRAGPSPERLRWAAAAGLDQAPGSTVLSIRLDDVVFDGDLTAGAFPSPPAGVTVMDAGFVDGAAAAAPEPSVLPAGMEPGRRGAAGPVVTRTWSDGRAWLAIRANRAWPGGRLFGGLGPFVVPVDLGDAGLGYAAADRSAIAVHADGIDLVVRGTVGFEALRRAAASVGVVGQEVPAHWAESATATVAEARRLAPDLLVLGDVDGFGPPAVRIDGETVTIRHVGPGDRAIEIVRTGLAILPPPTKPPHLDATGIVAVEVRGTTGRYADGDLEWVEGGRVRVLRGAALSVEELLTLAGELRLPS